MKNFIEVPVHAGKTLINVNNIVKVSKYENGSSFDTSDTDSSIEVFNSNPVHALLSYEEVIALIEKAQDDK